MINTDSDSQIVAMSVYDKKRNWGAPHLMINNQLTMDINPNLYTVYQFNMGNVISYINIDRNQPALKNFKIIHTFL